MKEPGMHLPGFITGVKPDQLERLVMLAEECGEVVQTITKILRHGSGSYHPTDPSRTPNRELLRQELVDLLAMIAVVTGNGDVQEIDVELVRKRVKAKKRYTHFQGPDTVW